MYTLLKPLYVRAELLKRNIRIFNSYEFMRIFHTPPPATKYFLETQVAHNFLVRLKRGLYMLNTDVPSEEEIANALYKPSYISCEYALAYYNVLPEMPYMVTSVTTKPTRLFTTPNGSFSYRTIKKEAFTGYSLIKNEQKSFLIAEKEKALVDYVYFVSLGKSTHNDRLYQNIKKDSWDTEKIYAYAQLFESKRLTTVLKTHL